MPAPLSNDLRERIMRAYNSGKPVKEIAAQFYVGQDSIYKLVKRVSETGSINPLPLNNGRKPKLSTEQMMKIQQLVYAQPDITLAGLIDELQLPITASALSKIIRFKLVPGRKSIRRTKTVRTS